MHFIVLALVLSSSFVEVISKGDDDILIQLEEDLASTRKRCNSSNSVIALLIDDLLKNATHVIDNGKFYNKTSLTDFPMNLDTNHIESAKTLGTISSNFSSPVKNVKDSIERSKESVESLKRTVSETLLSFKTESESVFTRRQSDEMDIIRNAVDRIKMKQDMSRKEVLEEIKLKNSKSHEIFPDAFYSDDGWQEAGYRVDDIEKIQEQCKNLLQSITLHRFELRPDTRRTDGQSINTTIQIGVSDWTVAKTILDASFLHDTDPIVDAITFFHCNLIVLSTLADRINLIAARIQATEASLDGLSIIHEGLLQNYRELNRSGVESMATLALNIGVLETETNMKRIKMEVKNITNAIDIALQKEKMEQQIYVAEAETQSLNKLTINENGLERNRMIQNQVLESVIDSTIEIISTVNELMEMNRAMIRNLEVLEKNTEADIIYEQSRIKAEALEERAQESFSINKIRIIGEEAKKSLVNMIAVISDHILTGVTFIVSTDGGRNQVLFYALAMTLLAFLISSAKEGISFLFWIILQSLSMPRLVREWGKGKCSKNSSVILRPDDMRKLEETIQLLQNRKKRNAPLRNILIHGAAGTGKSLIARLISESTCGLPYAIMSGADIAPLGSIGASELRKVITWTAKQKYGGILVIDEAECALGKRIRRGTRSIPENRADEIDKLNASSYARDVLNVFLSLTGGLSGKLMLVITTSNPSAIDEAILDRCDDMIFCSIPGYQERKQILLKEIESRFSLNQKMEERKFFSKLFGQTPRTAIDTEFNIENAVAELSSDNLSKGMTGRDLSSIIRSVHCAVYSSDEPILTKNVWERATKDIVASIQTSKLLKK